MDPACETLMRTSWVLILVGLALTAGCAAPADRPGIPAARPAPADRLGIPAAKPGPADYARLAKAIDGYFRESYLPLWYPRCVDKVRGGFRQAFADDWTPQADANRFLVFQSRLTWVAATAAMYDPALKAEYLPYALHGLDYLDKVMTDRFAGGLFWQVDLAGRPMAPFGDEKHAYGLSFAIYASAAVYEATREARALALASATFDWLDRNAHDRQHGGYFEALARNGRPLLAPPKDATTPRTKDGIGTPYGYKSMNTHIHLLEAFTALYRVAPEDRLRQRLEEMAAIVRDRIAVEPGCLNYYFTPDWRAVPMHDSFGHDVEAAFLVVEAAQALGRPDDEPTWRAARRIVDHALEWGWDDKNGGFYNAGQAFAEAHDKAKVWWVQAEGLNALLLMHERYGRETDRYWRAFAKQLRFLWNHQIDHQRGGWRNETTEDGTPKGDLRKASPWKEAYHDSRALMNVARRLNELAEAKRP
jgi:mannobiose 2-epimerase